MLMFSLKQMPLRKITSDNSVKYIPQSNQTSDIKPNTIKNSSLSRKQDKNISQNSKKFNKDIIIVEGFRIRK